MNTPVHATTAPAINSNMVSRWSAPILCQPFEIVRKEGETPFSQSVLEEKTTLVSLRGNNLEFSVGLTD
jgi:hypothetical protein